MLKNKRLLLLTLLLMLAAMGVLGMKIGYPHHRLTTFILLGLGWIPLILSYRINRRLLRVQKALIRKKARPYRPHIIVALILLLGYYLTWALFPVTRSPLADLTPPQLRAALEADLGSYRMLRETADDITETFRQNGWLGMEVDTLTPEARGGIRRLWRDGTMAFLEFDLLKDKYRGFYQIDYVAEPALHADAFLLAYMTYVVQYSACLQLVEMVGDNEFMSVLLNEAGEGIPAESYYTIKQRLTHPNVVLRLNAAAAYYELVKKDVTIDPAVVADFEKRRSELVRALGANAGLFIENPLEILEHAAFETMLPLQKNVAVQMSYIRTARRDYLITPTVLAEQLHRLEPGDILIQRRNWHMTNIGIPGFWPHTALYIGSPAEAEAFFGELGFPVLQTVQSLYPEAFAAWNRSDEEGFLMRVIEAIRPGVVIQSLETSARCDYLAVLRPNRSHTEKFKALLAAFSHFGKPYDLNFDFTTDNELVCSELVYKAYRNAGTLPLQPEVINGRRLLPPNRLAEQAVAEMGEGKAFSFVLFLDALEKDKTVVERDEAAFRASWQRPKWDILQQ